jgi:hypothetical protein
VIAAIDDGHVDRQFGQRFGGVRSSESAADDQDARPARCLIRRHGFGPPLQLFYFAL